uniref:Uncharacterized protein n=1 Tax=Setaria viridis TaxID=4556 RepID=A0A4U6WHP3_SETVI|nr:hypothetical protein SEVIR_1G306633v2 [Setaria viridis]
MVIPPAVTVATLWDIPRLVPQLPATSFATCCVPCVQQLWKHRHDVVFRGQDVSLPRLRITCKEEARLWRCRLPREDKW